MKKERPALLSHFTENLTEAGCDEAGRGCLAAVILPRGFRNDLLTDSKQLSEKQRESLRPIIEREAISWAVALVSEQDIDRINILNASILAMHKAVAKLEIIPELLLIDGNRFKPVPGIPHRCIAKGDQKFLSIAAASVLAKTYRDDFMVNIDREFPVYRWKQNKGYPSLFHRRMVAEQGFSPYHRKTFRVSFNP